MKKREKDELHKLIWFSQPTNRQLKKKIADVSFENLLKKKKKKRKQMLIIIKSTQKSKKVKKKEKKIHY